jgi:hypothetical protein
VESDIPAPRSPAKIHVEEVSPKRCTSVSITFFALYFSSGDDRHREEARRDQQHPAGTDQRDKDRGERRAGERASGSTRGDETVEPARLRGVVDIGHQAPEHADRKQVEHRHPDEERKCHDSRLRAAGLEQHEKADEVRDEKGVQPRQEALAREGPGQPTEHRRHDQHGEEHRGEQLVQSCLPDLHGHFVADRPQHVIAREKRVKARE